MSGKVELRCAYEWTCEKCGRDNFERAVTVEMTPDDIEAMKQKYGGDDKDWQTGNWMSRPDEVTCPHCGATFETEDWEGPSRPGCESEED